MQHPKWEFCATVHVTVLGENGVSHFELHSSSILAKRACADLSMVEQISLLRKSTGTFLLPELRM